MFVQTEIIMYINYYINYIICNFPEINTNTHMYWKYRYFMSIKTGNFYLNYEWTNTKLAAGDVRNFQRDLFERSFIIKIKRWWSLINITCQKKKIAA